MAKLMMAATGLALGLLMLPVAVTAPAQAADDKISCARGLQIVKRSGFIDVRASDCEGRTYAYSGRRGAAIYIIEINSRTGKIRNIRRTFISQ